ncbi:carbohydrate ABC transporter permease [Leadbettera azotonutricia]|uniref:L-arabinose ABC transport permease protein n=1 Tax=Leadbettera azotonutricia (strain ATCC BAA-888 / DSM 13862 / ZAS-9) TaxID=545695 RepID=F5Y890_LEAAZ|nr:sugar ABC transporter permease [Leadbettera azotonutricia]AEF83132.1 L-arabinose ABC transport permease protein [Leadbettera azotonutricia ZAS-9]
MKGNFPIKQILKNRNAYIFISPFFILYGLFGLYPTFFALFMSLSRYSPSKGFQRFVGFGNYINIIKDPLFWTSFKNTLWFIVLNVPVQIFFALCLAALFNVPKIRGRKIFQLAFLLPYVTSSVAYSIVFKVLFDSRIGLFNGVLNKLGLPSIPWITDPNWTKITVSIIVIWAWVGYDMLIMLGGLQNIDPELYEAARIDGASGIQSYFHITIPLMRPVIYFVTTTSTIGTFNMFNEPFILFGYTGGVSNAALTMNMYLYSQSFQSFQLSIGAAMSFIIFLFIMIFSMPQVSSTFKSNL